MTDRQTSELPLGWSDAPPGGMQEVWPAPVGPAAAPPSFWDDLIEVLRELLPESRAARGQPAMSTESLPQSPTSPAVSGRRHSTSTPGDRGRLDGAERDALIADLVGIDDQLASDTLSARLYVALGRLGVTTMDPAGQRFEPLSHVAATVRPTSDPALDGTIAETVRIGLFDQRRDRVIRPARVIIYRAKGGVGEA